MLATNTSTRVLKQLTIAIGWLSGSMTGICAVLYSLGYLATSAHLYSLGIDTRLVDYSNQDYLQRGAAFLLVSATLMTHVLSALAIILGAGLAVYWLFRTGRFPAALKGGQEPAAFLSVLLSKSWRYVAFAALVLVFVFRLMPSLDLFRATLAISDRLYAERSSPSARVPNDIQGALETALRSAQSDQLELHYVQLLVSEVTAALVFLGAYYVTSAWSYQPLFVAPFALIFLTYTVFLPMTYGVLMIPVTFPRAELLTAGGAGDLPGDTSFLLLNKKPEEFILWDPVRKAVVWIPARELRRATFTRGATATTRPPAQPPRE